MGGVCVLALWGPAPQASLLHVCLRETAVCQSKQKAADISARCWAIMRVSSELHLCCLCLSVSAFNDSMEGGTDQLLISTTA